MVPSAILPHFKTSSMANSIPGASLMSQNTEHVNAEAALSTNKGGLIHRDNWYLTTALEPRSSIWNKILGISALNSSNESRRFMEETVSNVKCGATPFPSKTSSFKIWDVAFEMRFISTVLIRLPAGLMGIAECGYRRQGTFF